MSISLCGVSLVGAQPTQEQNNAPIGYLSKTTIIPPSPEASSLGQYGNVPVSLYNGRINLSIPIYELKTKEMSVPISLSYNSGGIKVGEDSGWAGTGWSLNAGGVITRSAQGRPDQCLNYYNKATQLNAGVANLNERQRQDFYEDVTKGYIETQPDSYFFNFHNLSGKFYINPSKEIVLIDYKPVTIQVSSICTNESTFTVVGPNGIIYKFSDREVTDLIYDDENLASSLDHYVYVSSWYLTEMISPNGIDTVYFEYQAMPKMPTAITPSSESMSYKVNGPTIYGGSSNGATALPCGDVSGPFTSPVGSTEMTRIFLSKIRYRDMEVIFSSSASNSAFGGKKLDYIQVVSKNLQVKKFEFTHSYFDMANETNDMRLRLDKITEFGPVSQVAPPYEFTYSAQALPNIASKAIDHWGYYNGNGGSLIPNVQDGGCVRGNGANRETDEELVKACSLTKVKYPTGGYTEFTFGAHIKNGTYSTTAKQIVEVSHPTSSYVLGGIYQTGQSCAGSARFNITNLTIPETATRASVTLPSYVWDEQQYGEGAKVFAGIIKSENFTFTGCNLYDYVINNYQLFEAYWFLEEDLFPLSAYSGLIPGSYKLVVLSEFSSLSPTVEVVYFTNQLQDVTTIIPRQAVGGLRIEKIMDYNAAGLVTGTKTYEYDNAKSFGDPNYVRLSTYIFEAPVGQDIETPPVLLDYVSYTMSISSSSTAALGTVMGSHVGYGQVTERWLDAAGISNGHKVFTYRNNNQANAGNTFGVDVDGYGQGDLLKEEIFDNGGNLINETEYEYAFDLGETRNSPGIALQFVYADETQSNRLSLAEINNSNGIYHWFYSVNEVPEDNLSLTNRKSFKVKNKSTTHIIHGSWQYQSKITKREVKNGQTLEVVVSNIFENPVHALPTKIEKVVDKGDLIRSELTYSSRSELISKVDVNANSQVIGAQKVDYEFQGGKSFPKDIFFSETETPFSKSLLSSKYVNRASYQYDFLTGNLKEYRKSDDVIQSFVWSKDNRYVIAEVQGAAWTDIAYSSFENGASEGSWVFNSSVSSHSKTGVKSHFLPGNSIVRSNLQPAFQYVVTYWAKDGVPAINGVIANYDEDVAGPDGWKYYKKIVSGVSELTISGTGTTLIDELRFTPVGSQMISFVHDDQYGLTHRSDASGRISIYEYYDNGKLKAIREDEGHLVKWIKYNYMK